MDTLATTMSLPEIQDLTRKTFQVRISKPTTDAVKMFFLKDSSDWSVHRKRVTEVDKTQIAEQKVEGASSAKRRMTIGYSKEIKRKTISITREVTGEAFKALTAHGLARHATNVADDIQLKIELDMRNFIGMATADSYVDNGGFTIDCTTSDGLSAWHAAHTLKYSATTYPTIISGAPALSDVPLETGEDYFTYSVRDNHGLPLRTMKATHLITTSKARMRNRVQRLFGSMSPASIEGTANTNSGVMNTYKNRLTHIEIDFDVDVNGFPDSAKSFHWILASLTGSPETSVEAYYISWGSPEIAPTEFDQDKFRMSNTARAFYGIGAVNFKGACISLATA